MVCPHCGKPVYDGNLFCTFCGGKLDVGAGNPPAGGQTGGAEDFTLGNTQTFSAPATEPVEPAFAAPEFDAPKPKKKRKLSKKVIIAIVSGAVAAALVLTVALNFRKIRGFFVLTFGSDEDYFEFVEEHEAERYAETIASAYAMPLRLLRMDSSGETTLSFTGNENLLSAFLKDLGVDYNGELSVLRELQLETSHNLTKDGMSVGAGLVISGQPIISANVTMDFTTQTIYYSIPELSDKIITLPGAKLMSGGSEFQETLEVMRQVGGLIPSEKELSKLLERYIGVALDALDNVTVDETTLEVLGVSQNCRRITMRISERTLAYITKAILQEAKTDETIRNLFRQVQNSKLVQSAVGAGALPPDAIMAQYNLLLSRIDELLEELELVTPSSEEFLVITDYVDSSHDVIGREVRTAGGTVFSYATAKNGKNVASKVEVGERIFLRGTGTQSGNKVTGEYVLTVSNFQEEHEVGRLLLTDFNVKSFRQGELNGKIRIVPSEELLSSLFGSRLMASILQLSAEFDFKTSGDSFDVDVNLLMGDEVMLGVSMKNSFSDGGKVSVPRGDLLDIQDRDAPEKLLNSLKLDQLRKSLRRTKLPAELLDYVDDAIEDMIEALEREMRYSSYGWEDEEYYGSWN